MSAPRQVVCEGCKIRETARGYSIVQHCCTCDIYFLYVDSYEKHNNLHHFGHGRQLPSAPFCCLDCRKDFYDESLFKNHLIQHDFVRRHTDLLARIGKTTNPGTKEIFLCNLCGRDFATPSLLKEHNCPSDKLHHCINNKCRRKFKMLASLISHLESGACSSGYDRKTINALILARDKKGLITFPETTNLLNRRNLELHTRATDVSHLQLDEMSDASTFSSSSGEVILTPSEGSEVEFKEEKVSSSGLLNGLEEAAFPYKSSSNSTPLVSDPADSGRLCLICFKTFRTRVGLEQHVSSPVHDPILYHCALPFMNAASEGRVRKFKTLSGLVMHVETNKCRGGQSTFEMSLALLGELAKELGFAGFDRLASQIGGKLLQQG